MYFKKLNLVPHVFVLTDIQHFMCTFVNVSKYMKVKVSSLESSKCDATRLSLSCLLCYLESISSCKMRESM